MSTTKENVARFGSAKPGDVLIPVDEPRGQYTGESLSEDYLVGKTYLIEADADVNYGFADQIEEGQEGVLGTGFFAHSTRVEFVRRNIEAVGL